MVFDLLQPVNTEVLESIEGLSSHSLGQQVVFHTEEEFPDLKAIQLVIVGVLDNRGSKNNFDVDLTSIRQELYGLFPGNWNVKIADLGDIQQGDEITDTHYLVKEVVSSLIKKKIIPIIIGGDQNLTYPLYRAYDNVEQMVNLVAVDSSFDVGHEEVTHTDSSYLSKIIVNEPNNLFNYTNLGYQVYCNSQYEIDLTESLYFDTYRLGEISANMFLAEPVFRDADLVSFDMNAVKSSDSGNSVPFVPNGLDGKEICTLSRYAGISDKVSVFGLFNQHNNRDEAVLIAQVLWYFIEGVNYRSHEYPFGSRENYIKFNVLVEEMELVFYKSDVTERWWIEIPSFQNQEGKLRANTLLPCSNEDYIKACENQVPERWWKAYRKNIL